jgi:hypothetical protein
MIEHLFNFINKKNLFFGKMKQSLAKNIFDMLIIQGIIDNFAFPTVFDKLGLLEYPKLMGDRGLRHAQKHRDIANTHFGAKKSGKDLDPRGISKYFKQVRKIQENFLFRHSLPNLIDNRFMDHIAVTPVNIRAIGAHFATSF